MGAVQQREVPRLRVGRMVQGFRDRGIPAHRNWDHEDRIPWEEIHELCDDRARRTEASAQRAQDEVYPGDRDADYEGGGRHIESIHQREPA